MTDNVEPNVNFSRYIRSKFKEVIPGSRYLSIYLGQVQRLSICKLMTAATTVDKKKPIKQELSQNDYPSNEQLLAYIHQRIDIAKGFYTAMFFTSIGFLYAGGWWFAPLLGSARGLYSFLCRITKLANIQRVVSNILEELKHEENLKTYGLIEIEDHESLDLFVTIDKKANFFISVQSKGKSNLLYDEEKDSFFGKRKGKSRQKWKFNPSLEMEACARWIHKNRQLFNLSSRQSSKVPHARIVVICKPTGIAKHQDHHYSTMNGEKILTVNKTFFVGEEDVAKLMKAFLANQIKYPST